MQAYWVLGPSPYKTSNSINAIIYNNIVAAQTQAGRPLKRTEVCNLIKLMKEKGFFESQQDSWSLFNSFIANMRANKLLTDKMPTKP